LRDNACIFQFISCLQTSDIPVYNSWRYCAWLLYNSIIILCCSKPNIYFNVVYQLHLNDNNHPDILILFTTEWLKTVCLLIRLNKQQIYNEYYFKELGLKHTIWPIWMLHFFYTIQINVFVFCLKTTNQNSFKAMIPVTSANNNQELLGLSSNMTYYWICWIIWLDKHLIKPNDLSRESIKINNPITHNSFKPTILVIGTIAIGGIVDPFKYCSILLDICTDLIIQTAN
jgi:hypothetical protein